MNSGETGRNSLDMERGVEGVPQAPEVAQENLNDVTLGRERAGVIGSAALSSNLEQETRQELNAERVEEMVAAENKLGEEARVSSMQPQMEMLVVPDSQGRIDKAAVRTLDQLVSRDGNHPGRLEAEVSSLRQKYLESWRMGR